MNPPVFENYGGHYHLRISTAEDLRHLLSLNDGRWLATSCPRFGVNVDATFLSYLDEDGNGRIVSDEVRRAVAWTFERLEPAPSWTTRQTSLPLKLIREETPQGKALVVAARHILENQNRPEATEITLEEIRNRQRIMANAVYNGDGVIPPECIEDPETRAFVHDLITAYGGLPDISGREGIGSSHLDRFVVEASAYLEWHAQRATALPYGESTPTMFEALKAVRDRAELFYAQCALVRFDPRVLEQARLREEELREMLWAPREVILEQLRRAPLATPNPESVLRFDEVNELDREAIARFRNALVLPLLGERDQLHEAEWRSLVSAFANYERWLASKPTTPLEALGAEKLRAYRDAPFVENLRAMIEADQEVAAELQEIQNLEKLTLYHQWLWEFANNYVSFPRLFSPKERASFQMGTLVLDAREYSLALRVENRASHANLAKNAGLFLLYLRVTGAHPSETFEVVVPVTRGSSIGLYVGRRGVFYGLDGKEYDAEITQIIENPINFWESIKEPFRRLRDLITTRAELIAQSVHKEAETRVTQVTSRLETGVQSSLRTAPQTEPSPEASSPPAAPKTTAGARDLMIGTGFVVAGLATSLKFLADTAEKLRQPGALLRLFYVLSASAGAFLAAIMAVTALTAWLKLRRRDLGILLQAGGWAINGRIRVTAKMGRLFVRPVTLPRNAKRLRRDLVSSLEKLSRPPTWKR